VRLGGFVLERWRDRPGSLRHDLLRRQRPLSAVTSSAARWLLLAAVATLLALAFTNPYGSLNQATYLLDPLHRAMPELFHRDWFVSQTPPYLPAFGWMTGWLYWIDPQGATAVLTAHVVVTIATYGAIYALIAASSRDLRAFVIVAALTAMTMGRTLGGNYLIAGYIQPMSLATLGWIFAMSALVRGRFAWCGLALALAGVVHVNYLVLGIGLFTLATLVRGGTTRRELALLLAPQLVVLAYYLPDLLAAAGPGPEALRILVDFHAPGHYAGGRLVRGLPELACWQLAAFAVLPVVPEARTLWRFSLVVFAIVVATTLLIMTPWFEWITQVRWSRIAPFGQLACQVLVAVALVRRPALARGRHAFIAGAVLLAVLETAHSLHFPVSAWLVAAVAVLGVLLVPVALARHALTAVAVLALVLTLWTSPRGRGLTTTPAGDPGELALEDWARTQTPVDALFLASPALARFRLVARRAVIADTKSPPLRPDLLVVWYRRLCAMVAVDAAPTHELVEQRWTTLSADQLEAIAREFGADYIVVSAATKLPGALAYTNDEYAVYRVAP
jgi:hypothetical protein